MYKPAESKIIDHDGLQITHDLCDIAGSEILNGHGCSCGYIHPWRKNNELMTLLSYTEGYCHSHKSYSRITSVGNKLVLECDLYCKKCRSLQSCDTCKLLSALH